MWTVLTDEMMGESRVVLLEWNLAMRMVSQVTDKKAQRWFVLMALKSAAH